MSQLAVAAAVARPGRCNPGGPVTVTPGRRTPVDTLQIDFIHSASAIGTWAVQEEFEFRNSYFGRLLALLLNLDYGLLYWNKFQSLLNVCKFRDHSIVIAR